MSQTKKGNWTKGQNWFVSVTTKQGIKDDYTFIDDINIPKLKQTFKLYKKTNSDFFTFGYWDIEKLQTKKGIEDANVFIAVWNIDLVMINMKGYKKVVNVDGVAIDLSKGYKNKDVSLILYQYLVNCLNYTILGDSEQYFGARKLWSKLSKQINVQVDIINTKTNEVEFENVILHHGEYNNDFDERLWSYSKSKHHLRSILTKIL